MLGGLAAGAFAVKSVGSVFQAGARIGSHSQLDGFGSIFFSGLLLFFSPFFFFLSDTTTSSVNPQTLLFLSDCPAIQHHRQIGKPRADQLNQL